MRMKEKNLIFVVFVNNTDCVFTRNENLNESEREDALWLTQQSKLCIIQKKHCKEW